MFKHQDGNATVYSMIGGGFEKINQHGKPNTGFQKKPEKIVHNHTQPSQNDPQNDHDLCREFGYNKDNIQWLCKNNTLYSNNCKNTCKNIIKYDNKKEEEVIPDDENYSVPYNTNKCSYKSSNDSECKDGLFTCEQLNQVFEIDKEKFCKNDSLKKMCPKHCNNC